MSIFCSRGTPPSQPTLSLSSKVKANLYELGAATRRQPQPAVFETVIRADKAVAGADKAVTMTRKSLVLTRQSLALTRQSP